MSDELAGHIADLAVASQTARTQGANATADKLEQETTDHILEAHMRGEIADPVAFHRQVSHQIIERHAPRLSDALGLGTLLRNKQ